MIAVGIYAPLRGRSEARRTPLIPPRAEKLSDQRRCGPGRGACSHLSIGGVHGHGGTPKMAGYSGLFQAESTYG